MSIYLQNSVSLFPPHALLSWCSSLQSDSCMTWQFSDHGILMQSDGAVRQEFVVLHSKGWAQNVCHGTCSFGQGVISKSNMCCFQARAFSCWARTSTAPSLWQLQPAIPDKAFPWVLVSEDDQDPDLQQTCDVNEVNFVVSSYWDTRAVCYPAKPVRALPGKYHSYARHLKLSFGGQLVFCQVDREEKGFR